ncbi:hypothetical protein [Leptospira sp. 'Mane']|uniref:hypothetical protein n=1 Tax=Leptospira sp. 'Mane' TaxID=3387407 RepID=UPI00398B8F1D
MINKSLTESVMKYLNSTLPGAVLIDGKWGAGKTHFVLKELLPSLSPDKQLIHISLNGIASINTFEAKLLSSFISSYKPEKFKIIREGVTKLTSAISKMPIVSKFIPPQETYSNELLQWFIKANPSMIYCFDDLERANQKCINDIIGYIQDALIEKMNCKVIIIANEQEIKDKDDYFKTKEKTILVTLHLSSQIQNYFDNYVETLNKDTIFKTFLTKNKRFITSLIENYKITNIRTFQFYLFQLERILIAKSDDIEDYLDNIKISSLLFCCFLSKEGLVNSEQEFKIIKENYLSHPPTTEIETKETKIHNLLKEYGSYSILDSIPPSFVHLIFNGTLDEDILKIEINRSLGKNIKNSDLVLKKLTDFDELSDLEIRKNIYLLIKYSKNGEYLPADYIRVCGCVEFLSKYGLKLKRIKTYLSRGLEKSLNYHKPDYVSLSASTRFIGRESDLLVSIINQLNNYITENKEINEVKIILNQYKDPQYKNKETLEMHSRIKHMQIFRDKIKDEIIAIIKEYSIGDLLAFQSILDEKYLQISNAGDHYFSEIQTIEYITSQLRNLPTNLNRKELFRKNMVLEFCNKLEEVSKHLKETKKTTT